MEERMVVNPNGVLSQIPAEQRLNVFALVIYIPDPLGRFLDDLRKELLPGCNPHAHVSVLPPRPLAVEWRVAAEQVRECASAQPAFEISLDGICMFPVTNVIYIELGGEPSKCARCRCQEPARWIRRTGTTRTSPSRKFRRLPWRRWNARRGRCGRNILARAASSPSEPPSCRTPWKRWIDLAEASFGAVNGVGLRPVLSAERTM
jgi:hypothetical protein